MHACLNMLSWLSSVVLQEPWPYKALTTPGFPLETTRPGPFGRLQHWKMWRKMKSSSHWESCCLGWNLLSFGLLLYYCATQCCVHVYMLCDLDIFPFRARDIFPLKMIVWFVFNGKSIISTKEHMQWKLSLLPTSLIWSPSLLLQRRPLLLISWVSL